MNLRAIKRIPFVYKTLLAARSVSGRAWMRLCHCFCGVSPKRVFFSSFAGKAYSDSPKFISEALHAMRPDIEIVWQLPEGASAPEYVRVVRSHTPAALKELSTVRCFVDNFNRPHYMLKFPGQLYVQTWHGDRGFKKMLYDMEDGVKYPDYLQMDLGVSGSQFGTKNYRSAFRYGGEVMQLGMPRNDVLVNPDPARVEEIRAELGIEAGVCVMLYAPTFRDATSGQSQKAGFDIGHALELLEKSTGRKWICLTRAHDQNRAIESEHAASIRDVTGHPEMSDLLLAADLLITDYSSSAGDFALLERPMILYQPDLDAFVSSDREMYFNMRTSPYVRAESSEALDALLKDFGRIPICGKAVLDFYGATESGGSAKAVARWISDRIPQ